MFCLVCDINHNLGFLLYLQFLRIFWKTSLSSIEDSEISAVFFTYFLTSIKFFLELVDMYKPIHVFKTLKEAVEYLYSKQIDADIICYSGCCRTNRNGLLAFRCRFRIYCFLMRRWTKQELPTIHQQASSSSNVLTKKEFIQERRKVSRTKKELILTNKILLTFAV